MTAAAAAEADEAAEQLPLARLGTLDDLRAAKRGGLDPNGLGAALVASDVLWSDPSAEVRGACVRAEHVPAHTHTHVACQQLTRVHTMCVHRTGCTSTRCAASGWCTARTRRRTSCTPTRCAWSSAATRRVLFAFGLLHRLSCADALPRLTRQGPDAREKRDDMGSMAEGWCVDHESPAGRLATLFSAPDYPQFYPEGEARANNRAAVARLRAPHFDEPELLHFSAAPRPPAQPFYDPGVAGSDEEGPDGEPQASSEQ
jgi:hypothetical protein